jgi:alkanesulfonate monooxygenase SsuD/methylene tetrahydromethanopterin reductase-like flavin-dependent oxidoreductase (luciferase family)
MRFGLALPQYDYSVQGEHPLRFDTIVEYARRAKESGFDSVWLSDHLFLDIGKYGGPSDREGCFDPVVTLAALARLVPDVRLGTLVFCEALRPAAVLAKTLATLDRVSAGRLDVGLGAGWYEPEYESIGMTMPPPPVRLARLAEAVEVVKGVLEGGPFSFDGAHHRATGASSLPPPQQRPRPRVFVGGKGDRWNTCWSWTVDSYRERLGVLERECERVDRNPSTVWRTLGLYALCGEDERDLARRFELMRASSPRGVLDGVDLAEFRNGKLVGTVDEVRAQVAEWESLGVETLVLGVGVVPFQVTSVDDVAMFASLRP